MIDVEELIRELRHIAGAESVDADIRRTACDAESALASLRAWVNELQMNTAERSALEVVSVSGLADRQMQQIIGAFVARCAR